jgi:hypothetical protein
MMVKNLMILFSVLIAISCGTSKKNITSTVTEVHKTAAEDRDSVAVKMIDSVHVKKDSSAVEIKNDSSFENKTIVEEEYKYIDTAMKLYKRKTTVIARGKKIQHTSLNNVVYDSARKQGVDSVAVTQNKHIDSTGKTDSYVKHVERKTFSMWWILLIIIICVGLAAYNHFRPNWFKKILSWLK